MISAELNNYRLAGVVQFLGQGKVELYEDTTLLAVVPLVNPVGSIANGVLTITPTPEAMIMNGGTANFARVLNGNGVFGWDCAVSDTTGTAPLQLSQTQLYAGGYVKIASGSLS